MTSDDRAKLLARSILGMSPDDRSEYLSQACGTDHALRSRVEQLLTEQDGPTEDLATLDMPISSPGPGIQDLSGRRLANRYESREMIGQGGFGSVYRAYDELLERDIALKVLHFSVDVAEGTRLDKMLSEARTVAKLDHRHIVPIYDAGLEGNTLWLAMRLIQGRSLERILVSEGRLRPSRVVELLTPIARALDHAHDKRIVHRDVKPSNILVEDADNDEVHSWLVDFGIARIFTGETSRRERALAGTPSYMAPEQITGRKVDGRADVFALGCVVWEALRGAPAFDGENFSQIAYRIVHEQARGFDELQKATSPETARLVQRALAKSAQDRFPTATSFMDALAQSIDPRRPPGRSFTSRIGAALRVRPRSEWDERDVLVADGVVKSYGLTTRALDGFDLRVPRGAIFAMLGRNGTGKTTAIRTFLGLYRPDRGNVSVFGRNPERERRAVLSRVGYVPESMDACPNMTVERFFGLLRSFHDTWDPAVHLRLLERFELPLDTKIKNLSRGMKTKISLISALATRPDLLVLDDPTIGLDVVILEEFFDTLREVCNREGTTALIASHNVDELQQIATHVAFLSDGKTRLTAPLADLLEKCRSVELKFDGVPPDPETLPGLRNVRASGRTIRGAVLDSSEVAIERLRRTPGASVQVKPMSLREIFLSHMK